MRRNALIFTVTYLSAMFFLSIFMADSFAQTLAANPQIPLKTQTACRSDWDCKKLDQIVKLDQNACYDQVRTFLGEEPIFQEHYGGLPVLKNLLLNMRYTQYLQTGYKVEYKCGFSGFCEVSKIDPYAEGTYERCQYGCLVDPIWYKGRLIQNTCLCVPGYYGRDKPHCDYAIGNDVYMWFIELDCKKSIQPWMICGTGGRCADGPEGIGCYPTEGKALYGSSNTIQYALTMPQGMDGPIYVVAMQNGRAIAKQPISNLSAEQYVLKYGPVNSADAYAFAQKVGLTSLVKANSTNSALASSNKTGTSSNVSNSCASTTNTASSSSWFSNWLKWFGFGKNTSTGTSYGTSMNYSTSYGTSTSYSTNATYSTNTSYSSYSYPSYTSYPGYTSYSYRGYSYSYVYYSSYPSYSYSNAGIGTKSYSNYSYSGYSSYSNYSSYSYPNYSSYYATVTYR